MVLRILCFPQRLFLIFCYIFPICNIYYSVASSSGDENESSRYHKRMIMLWADGRCGTTSLTNTMFQSQLVSYCKNNEKEAFNYRYAKAIDKQDILDLCTETGDPRTVFMHIKPLHVLNITGLTGGDMPEFERYDTIRAFFREAHAAGVKLVMVIRRENLLAHMVSVFELHTAGLSVEERYQRASELFVGRDILEYIKRKYVETEVGVQEAQRLGMPMLQYEFAQVTRDVCNTTLEVARAMQAVGVLFHPQQYIDNFHCVRYEFNSLFDSGPRTMRDHPPLMVRVGRNATRHIKRQLRGTPWSWMLEVNRKHRPIGASPADPCANISACIPVSTLPTEQFVPM